MAQFTFIVTKEVLHGYNLWYPSITELLQQMCYTFIYYCNTCAVDETQAKNNKIKTKTAGAAENPALQQTT